LDTLTTTGSSPSATILSRAADRFEFRNVLRHGRTGSLYRARDRFTDVAVTMKLLPFDLSGKKAREAFEKRAKALSSIDDPCCAPVRDFGYHYGLAYIVADDVQGETLDRYLKQRGPFEFGEFAVIFATILRALAAAHDKGLVHGDVQPSHIVLTDDGERVTGLTLVGFGFPDLMNDDAAINEETRHVSNVEAIAPERLLRNNVDHRLDLYALGATAYEMLTGKQPFTGASIDNVFRTIYEDPEPIADALPRNTDVPDSALELIENLVEKSPVDRPSSAKDALFWFESAANLESYEFSDVDLNCLSTEEMEALELADDIAAARPSRPRLEATQYEAGTMDSSSRTIHVSDARTPYLSLPQMLQVLGLMAMFTLFVALGWLVTMKLGPDSEDQPPKIENVAESEIAPPEDEDPKAEIQSLFTKIDIALTDRRFGTAEALLEQLEAREDFPSELRGTLNAYRSRLEMNSKLERARRLENSGRIEDALLIYSDIAEKYPNHANVPKSIERLENSFVLNITSNTRGIVSVDGEPLGVTPFTGILPISTERITVARKGYRSWSIPVDAEGGTRVELEADLTRRPARERPDRQERDIAASPFMDLMEMGLDN
jgi:serine/threonine protein kinase